MTTTKKAILTQGLPGAGKSWVLGKNYNLEDYTVIDPDEIKKEKADYNDKQPEIYHEWSKAEAKFRMAAAIHKEENLVIDGTGTNVEKMAQWMIELQAAGYEVELLYVKVKLQTALDRNTARPRVVPAEIIYEKYETITTAFEILASIANTVTVISND